MRSIQEFAVKARPVSLALARDLVLLSERNGAPAIYWLDPSTYGALFGARGLRLITTIFDISANTLVTLFAQGSYGERTWTDFENPLTDDYATVGLHADDYPGTPAEFGPMVRIGIQVKGTAGEQVQVRLTSTAIVMFGNVTTGFELLPAAEALSINANPTDIGNSFDLSNYDSAEVLLTFAAAVPTNLVFSVWVGTDGSAYYAKVAETASYSAALSGNTSIYLSLPSLSSNMQLRYTMSGGVGVLCSSARIIGHVA